MVEKRSRVSELDERRAEVYVKDACRVKRVEDEAREEEADGGQHPAL